jgi:hypothetical protein
MKWKKKPFKSNDETLKEKLDAKRKLKLDKDNAIAKNKNKK